MIYHAPNERGEPMNDLKKQHLIEAILKIEWRMFTTVNATAKQHPEGHTGESKPPRAACQDYPDEFRVQRDAIFQTWSNETLQSYLRDLQRAEAAGENLMTIKYARMDNLIPCRNESPLIDEISAAKVAWQKEFMARYPGIMSQGRALKGGEVGIDWASFETYTKSELETYSDATLQHLRDDIEQYKKSDINMSEAVYKHLVKAKGYDSLDAAEAVFS